MAHTQLTDDLLTGPVAQAFREAETRKAARAAELRVRAEAQAAAKPHVYDPGTAPDDEKLYEGTGIGYLYGLSDPKLFAHMLGDWKVIRR